jgi:hypothetical protein
MFMIDDMTAFRPTNLPTISTEEQALGSSRAPLALSIRQPWAWAILYAGKRIENRTWYTGYRGLIFIHAGLRVDQSGLKDLSDAIKRIPEPRPPAHCGALVAIANLVDCVPSAEVPSQQREWALGPWCFVLDNVRPLATPVAHRGALGLFRVDPCAELRVSSLTKSTIFSS